jgi:hypothetical protein
VAIAPLAIGQLASRSAFETPPPEQLFHYTDLDGVKGILASKSLWLSKFTASNDISEITLAISQFQSFVASRAGSLPEPEAEFLHEAAVQLEGFRRTNICVASFCEQPDLLSQWRSYGDDGRGIAFGFSTRILKELARRNDLRLWRCVYDRSQHVRILNDLFTMLLESFRAIGPATAEARRQLIGHFNATFLLVAPVIKDHRFAEEQEWRLISSPVPFDHPRMLAVFAETHASVKYSLAFGREREEWVDLIPRVTIGPTPLDPQNIADAIEVHAAQNGFRIPDIGFSGIPYRRTDL